MGFPNPIGPFVIPEVPPSNPPYIFTSGVIIHGHHGSVLDGILTKTIAASPNLRASMYLHLLFNLNLNLFGQATHAATPFLNLR